MKCVFTDKILPPVLFSAGCCRIHSQSKLCVTFFFLKIDSFTHSVKASHLVLLSDIKSLNIPSAIMPGFIHVFVEHSKQTNVNTTDGTSTQETDEAMEDTTPNKWWSVLCVNPKRAGGDEHTAQHSVGKYSKVVLTKCLQLSVSEIPLGHFNKKTKMSNNLHLLFKYYSTG